MTYKKKEKNPPPQYCFHLFFLFSEKNLHLRHLQKMKINLVTHAFAAISGPEVGDHFMLNLYN